MTPTSWLPVVDISVPGDGPARQIEAACRETGFFYVTGHGVSPALLAELDAASRAFFALPEAEKSRISMDHGGRAWRGYFPVGGELTSGRPDLKEGVYFGTEQRGHHRSRDQISSTRSWPYARTFFSSSRVKPTRW
ncbi:2-oxoglutarate and iron-dependent oxygenase domain-containing protein [Phytohabitans kaempferiae]|uniref:2-oxoglutarate and iron-dependent oxygenase domain-containing protein n=1 Tax=Phytohabitans kaempferiae TaxID=1620943 RepID=A0ABV6LW08_9ACTN